MKRVGTYVMAALFAASLAYAGDVATENPKNAQGTSDEASKSTLKETGKLSEDLIYSVDRSPERPFDTARSVEVITSDQIARRAGRGLADVLAETAGVYVRRGSAGGGAAVIRGLAADQVLILVDGVKLTNGTWGDPATEYLNLIDVSQIDRVEIVRGVVSVLGTESLGGIVNIITKKGPATGESFAGSVGLRYSTADSGFMTPLTLAGQNGNLRYAAGMTFGKAGDLRAGGNIGNQAATGYRTRSGYGSAQYLLTAEKTISAMFSDVEQRDVQILSANIVGPIDFAPARTRLGSLSYLDLTSRPWADSFRATAYWNRQSTGTKMLIDIPRLNLSTSDGDHLFGAGVEGGKFLGTAHVHHLVYGVDFSTEKTNSSVFMIDEGTGIASTGRSATTPGAQYRTLGTYVQDHFDVGRLTAAVGARYGVFALKGSENDTGIGVINIDNTKSDYAGSVNLIYHLSPSLNLIGNVIRGFRTPNLYDATGEVWGNKTLLVPTTDVSTERVRSYEMGAKYQSDRASGSAFLFRNRFSNLLVVGPGTLNGLSFYDTNFNRVRDPWENINILQNRNVGAGTIDGAELEGRLRIADVWTLLASYTRTRGTNTVTNDPFPDIPPTFGTVSLGYFPVTANGAWGELVYNFAGSQHRLAPTELADSVFSQGTASMHVVSVRGGLTVAGTMGLTLELQNIFDEKYRYHDSNVYEPGRQLIVSTQYRF